MARTRRNRKASVKPSKKTRIEVDIPMFGRGSYTSDKRSTRSVAAPAAKGTHRQQRAQKTVASKHSERIAGSGILCEIGGNDNPVSQQIYAINPGLQAIFPWVSEIAQGFTRYKIHSLRFHFRTSAPTTAPGNITLFGDANVTSYLPSTLVAAVSYEGAVTGPIWDNLSYSIPVKNEVLYLRNGMVPSDQDPKTYDSYQLSWLYTGPVTTYPVGYIETEYDIEFIDRRTRTTTMCECISNLSVSTDPTPLWSCLNQMPVMGTPTFSLTSSGSGYYVGFPAGKWMVQITFIGRSVPRLAANAGFTFTAGSTYDSVELLPAMATNVAAGEFQPGAFGEGVYYFPDQGQGMINCMLMFAAASSAGEFFEGSANPGWFSLVEHGPYINVTDTFGIMTVSCSYMGTVDPVDLTSASSSAFKGVSLMRTPAHLAHIPHRASSSSSRVASTSTYYATTKGSL